VVKKKLIRAYATSVSNYFDDLDEKFEKWTPVHIWFNFDGVNIETIHVPSTKNLSLSKI